MKDIVGFQLLPKHLAQNSEDMKKMFDPAVEKAKMKYFLVGFGSSGVEPFDPVGKDCTCSGDGKQLF